MTRSSEFNQVQSFVAHWDKMWLTIFLVFYCTFFSLSISRTRLFENLRMLPHAPGVQMSDIPADGQTLKDESEANDEANPDKRNPQAVRDKKVEADNEFEESASGNKDNSSSKDEPMEVDTKAAGATAAASDT